MNSEIGNVSRTDHQEINAKTSSRKVITKSELRQKASEAQAKANRENRRYSSNSNWITTSLLAVLILGFGILTEKDISQPARACAERDHAACEINSLITQAESFGSVLSRSGSYSSTRHSKGVSNNLLIQTEPNRQKIICKFSCRLNFYFYKSEYQQRHSIRLRN